jgi:hypothetical protein
MSQGAEADCVHSYYACRNCVTHSIQDMAKRAVIASGLHFYNFTVLA